MAQEIKMSKKWHAIDLYLDAKEAKAVYEALIYYYAQHPNARATTYNIAQRMLNIKYEEEL